MKKIMALLLALICTVGTCGFTHAEEVNAVDAYNWYEVFVYSYQDSNGDGIGDLKGLYDRLDYIHEMG